MANLADFPDVKNLSEETFNKLMALPGWVIVARTGGGNQYHLGYCENSFSMSLEPALANFWWVGTARSNFGTTYDLTAQRVEQDARENISRLQRNHSSLVFELIDVRAADCPIELDWNNWLWGNQSSDKTLSGVVDKYAARNLRFWMKGESNPFKTMEGRLALDEQRRLLVQGVSPPAPKLCM